MITTFLIALQILITLSAPISGNTPDGYKIERKIGSGNYSQISQQSTLSYTDNISTDPGTSYCYRAKSYTSTSESVYSIESCVNTGTTQPPPTGGSPLPPGYTFFSAEYGRNVMSQSGSLAFGSSAAGFYFRNVLQGEIIYCQQGSFPGAPSIGNPSCFFKPS